MTYVQDDLGARIPLVLIQYNLYTTLKYSAQNRKTRNLKIFGVVKKLEEKNKKYLDHAC